MKQSRKDIGGKREQQVHRETERGNLLLPSSLIEVKQLEEEDRTRFNSLTDNVGQTNLGI